MDMYHVFPFVHIVDDTDYLEAIWNLNCDKSNNNAKVNSGISINDLCFNPFDNEDFCYPNNLDSTSCKYITTEDLSNRTLNKNQFTITQINTRSLKTNFL